MINLEKRKEWCRKYYQNNKERYKENSRRSRANNREKNRERNRIWYSNNPEWVHIKNRKPNHRFSFSRSGAKRKGYEWNISFSDFCEYLSKRCHYCNGSLPESGSGLDRMDNTKGYLIGNVVPCCRKCNLMKGNHLTYEEMVAAMKAVLEVRKKKILSSLEV